MAYSGMSKRVKNALKTFMAELQVDGEPAFVRVIGSMRGEFDAYPALRILPNDLTTTKASVKENDKSIQFIFRVSLPLENNPLPTEAIIDQMYDLTDLLVDRLDSGDYDGALSQVDPSLEVLRIDASRGDWLSTQSAVGLILNCDVAVAVLYSRDL